MVTDPRPFRDRPRTTSIHDDDVFPLSRMTGGIAKTFSIAWSDMSSQITAEVAEARQDMVNGFVEQQAWAADEIATKEHAVAAGTTGQWYRGDKTWQSLMVSDVSGLTAALSAKAPIGHMHAQNDISGLVDGLAGKVQAYGASGVQIVAPRLYAGSKATTSGMAVFYLTVDGTASGAALFPTGVLSVQPAVNDATTVYPCSWTIVGKVLTMTVNKAATPLLSLLGINILAAPTAAPNGTTVQLLVLGH